jgi:hypothetical protein
MAPECSGCSTEAGAFIAGSVQDSPADALLAVAEHLLPPDA